MLQHFRHVSKYRLFLIIKREYCEKVENLWYGSPKSLSNSVNGISNSTEIQVMHTCRWWVRNLFHIPSFHGLFHLNVNVHQYQISSIVTVLCIFKRTTRCYFLLPCYNKDACSCVSDFSPHYPVSLTISLPNTSDIANMTILSRICFQREQCFKENDVQRHWRCWSEQLSVHKPKQNKQAFAQAGS